MANGRALANPPNFTPARFGLLSAAMDATAGAPAHWQAGVVWQSHCPAADGTYDPCLVETADGTGTPGDPDNPDGTSDTPAPAPPVKPITTDLFLRAATPFAVLARFDCSPVSTQGQNLDLATQALARVEGYEVERIFDSGIVPREMETPVATAFPHLRADTGLVEDGQTLQTIAQPVTLEPQDDLAVALGLLEEALADCYHGTGVIHIPGVLGPQLARDTLVTVRGDQMFTTNGNSVALGSGYSGAAPDGSSAGDVVWMYATGAVFYYRSGVEIKNFVQSFNRSNNTVSAIAERKYLFGWDCCHLAIPVFVGSTGVS